MLTEFIEKLNKIGEVYLQLKILPGANKNDMKGLMADGTVKLNIAAPPEKGKANRELTAFLANIFLVPKENVKIISGAGTRKKLVKIIKI